MENRVEMHSCVDYYQYTLFPDSSVEIRQYVGHDEAVNIPTALDEHLVISIGEEAFCSCESLTSVVLPEGIQYIGERAFADCRSLTSVTLPNNIGCYIEDSAFQGCSDALTFVVFPDSGGHEWVKENNRPYALVPLPTYGYSEYTWWPGCAVIEKYNGDGGDICVPQTLDGYPVICIWEKAFYACKALTSIALPEGLECIAEEAFMYCEALTSITLPKGLKTIGMRAFDSCCSLRSVKIPSSVQLIGYDAFEYCSDDLVFKVVKGSYAHQWAEEMKHPYIYSGDQD